jgi:DNA-binding transcriptional regulator YhcF (GntR family)
MKKLIVTPEGTFKIDLTNADIAQREQDAIKDEADKLIREEKIAQEKAKKESAIAKLKALGLTEEEVKSIL